MADDEMQAEAIGLSAAMAREQLPLSPSEMFGELFASVQASGIFDDSKTFADAVPLRSPDSIMADWARFTSNENQTLGMFVEANFDVIEECLPEVPDAQPLRQHIADLWPWLTRAAYDPPEFGSALWLPRPFTVPGGRFRELYYWDSYFTMLGLGLSGRQDLVEDMIVNMGSLIDRYGHIPNGSRSYYLSRSHPPVFHLAAALSHDQSREARAQRLDWMRAEHCFWMDGEGSLMPGEAHRRVVRLSGGELLNRYWDDRPCPRDESWKEDTALAAVAAHRDPAELWRDVRAAAESGWDFSSRWLADKESLASIRTTRLVPIDLNSLLYGLEIAISRECYALDDKHEAEIFEERAKGRAAAINLHLWNDVGGHYADYDLDSSSISQQLTAAAAFPLFTGLCSHEQAGRSASALRSLLRPWGLSTTLIESGQQWDAPNGWAPLQWVACQGLKKHGENELADDIARRWSTLVQNQYCATGQIFEKYDVVTGQAGHGGEYSVEIGFGWTNGVALALGVGGVA